MYPLYLSLIVATVVDINKLPNSPAIIEFYAPWCSHCRKFAPEYAAASDAVPSIPWTRLNCDENDCFMYQVLAYPTVVYSRGNGAPFVYFLGVRDAQTVATWASKLLKAPAAAVAQVPRQNKPHRLTKKATHTDVIKGFCDMARFVKAKVQREGTLSYELSKGVLSLMDTILPWQAQPNTPLITNATWDISYCGEYEAKESLFCARSKTCLWWTMMHAVVSKSKTPVETLLLVSQTVRDTLPCAECSMHFNNTLHGKTPGIGPASHLESHEGVVLWLWRAHNEVNSRLDKEQFPGVGECPLCRNTQDTYVYLETVYGESLMPVPKLPIVALTTIAGPLTALMAHFVCTPSSL